ncbi:MAG: uncharacterized protein PWP76_344 [Candidatus Diapherotrites archaeon]|nr:uncharacterized protein [Candidatus Diapherotrites archaeon]
MEGSFPLKLVKGYPAAVYRKTLIVADLHIGIEREFWRKGIRVSGLSRKTGELLEEVLDITKPKCTIVAGDLKHNIPDFTQREAEEVKRVTEFLASQGELLIIKGNHDGDLEKIIPWAHIAPGSGIKERDIYILHGHANPSMEIYEAKAAVMGHLHPAITLKHRFGVVKKKVFLTAEWQGIPVVVLPAFSPLIDGMDVTQAENLIGPVAKQFERADAYLMDGTYVRRVL